MPELIMEGKTGFLVKDVAEAVLAVQKIAEIQPQDCHDHAIRHFSQDRMIDEYVEVYKKVLKDSHKKKAVFAQP